MVKIMLASHGNLAAGMLSSAEMVFGKQDNVSVICAYVDGEDDVSTRIKGFIDSIAPDDSWIIISVLSIPVLQLVKEKIIPIFFARHCSI